MADAIVQLNGVWRITDDPPQWVLEQREGNPRSKASGWRQRKFIRSRDQLLQRISELCGKVDPNALDTIGSWPVGYVAWKLREIHTRAGPGNGPYSAVRASDHPNCTSTDISSSGG